MNDLVRGGFAQVIAAPTESGYVAYGAGRYFAPLPPVTDDFPDLVVPGAVLDLRADLATGTSQGVNDPFTDAWQGLDAAGNDGTLTSFDGDEWGGAGTNADPYKLTLNGSDEYIACPDLGAWEDKSFTYEAWFLTTSAATVVLIAEGSSTDSTHFSYLAVQSTCLNGYTRAGGTGVSSAGLVAVNTGAIMHGLLTVDGTNQVLYRNGVRDGAAKACAAGTPALNRTAVGALVRAAPASYFPGSVLVARIYPFALTPEQVAQNYAAGPRSHAPSSLVFTDLVTIDSTGVTPADGKFAYARNDGNYYGPVIVTDAEKSAGWQTAVANYWNDNRVLFDTFCAGNDVLIPLNGDSRGYRKGVSSASPFDSMGRFVFDGDSLSVEPKWPAIFRSLYGDLWDWVNLSASGEGSLTILQDAAEVDAVYDSSAPRNWVSLWCGSNDGVGTPVAETIARITSYCSGRRALGFKVVVLTMLPRGDRGDEQEPWRQALNTLLRANWASYADALADVASDPRIGDDGDCNDTTYYLEDTVHLTAAGYAIVAGIVKTAIESLL